MSYSILWKSILKGFEEICSEYDHVWMTRRRRFDTYSLLQSLMDLVAGSESCYASVMHRFETQNKIAPAASSFCEARSKLPSSVLAEINRDLFELVSEETDPMKCFGYTALAMDGSIINLPAKMIGKGFRCVNSLCPSALLTSVVRLSDRMLLGLDLSSTFDEGNQAHKFLENLDSEHLVVYDRGYLSFGLLNDHINRGVAGIFRVSCGNIFRELQEFMLSDSVDEVMEIDPTDATYRNTWKMRPGLQVGPVEVRAIKYKIGKTTYLLVTTILDQTIPLKALQDLYHRRWRIEEFLKTFKVTINAEEFHSRSVNGIEQEVQAAGILWNLSRAAEIIGSPFKKKPSHAQRYRIISAILDR